MKYKLLRIFVGLLVGVQLVGLIAGIALALGAPTGPGWFILGVPLIMGMAYLATITK